MSRILDGDTVDLDDIHAIKRTGRSVTIGDMVRAIRVKTPSGAYDYFYRKDGTYQMAHAGTANVGEYEHVVTAFPEYTAELSAERTDLINMIGASVQSEIDTLEGAYNV